MSWFKKIFNIPNRPVFMAEKKVSKPSGMYICLDGKKVYINMQKEVNGMDFDLDKISAYYNELVAKREQAVNDALANKNTIVQEREAELKAKYEEEKASIPAEVEAEIIAKAEEPYLHDIALCEKFIKTPEEEITNTEAE